MLIAIRGVTLYAQCYTQGVKLYAHCYTWELHFMLNAIQGVKLYPHCYTSSEALCSLL